MVVNCSFDNRSHWTFFGRVIPERHPLRFQPPDTSLVFSDPPLSIKLSVGIADGQILADVEITSGNVEVHRLQNLIELQLRFYTDFVGYKWGGSFDIDMIGAVCRDTGERCVFGVIIPVLNDKRKGDKNEIDSLEFSLLSADVSTRIALANFREAIRMPVETGFYCFRAVETMMQSMKTHPNENDKEAWLKFRSALRVDRSFIDQIKIHADLPRHGKPSAISDAERSLVFLATDTIMDRYLKYVIAGRNGLPETDFDMLVA
jgi:hypothetical protein